MEVAIHVDAAERALNGVDHAVLIAIQFLEVIVRQVRILRVWDARLSRIWARIVALWVLEDTVIHQIRSRLDDGFGHDFFLNLDVGANL
jgi:hypothetical protein